MPSSKLLKDTSLPSKREQESQSLVAAADSREQCDAMQRDAMRIINVSLIVLHEGIA